MTERRCFRSKLFQQDLFPRRLHEITYLPAHPFRVITLLPPDGIRDTLIFPPSNPITIPGTCNSGSKLFRYGLS